jgi:hypothetical protein
MNDRNWRAPCDLDDATYISGCDQLGHYFIDISDLSITQPIRQF